MGTSRPSRWTRRGTVLVTTLFVVACGTRPSPPGPSTAQPVEEPLPPGSGCHDVVISPPCTLKGATPLAPGAGEVELSWYVIYVDAQGREIQPYFLRSTPEERPELEAFFRDQGPIPCEGGWTSPPCNDTPYLSGFPEPPVGTMKAR